MINKAEKINDSFKLSTEYISTDTSNSAAKVSIKFIQEFDIHFPSFQHNHAKNFRTNSVQDEREIKEELSEEEHEEQEELGIPKRRRSCYVNSLNLMKKNSQRQGARI